MISQALKTKTAPMENKNENTCSVSNSKTEVFVLLKKAESDCQAAYKDWQAAQESTQAAKEKWEAATLVHRTLYAKLKGSKVF